MSRNSETHVLPEHATWGQALVWGVERLRASAIGDTPDLDAQTLLAHTLGVSRATLLAYPERRAYVGTGRHIRKSHRATAGA